MPCSSASVRSSPSRSTCRAPTLAGMLPGVPFLVQKNVGADFADLHHWKSAGRRIVVLGGGDTAMDCLQTARSPRSASIGAISRTLPGSCKEHYNALKEGAKFQFLTNPLELIAEGYGAVAAVRCVRTELGELGASGRRKPRQVAASELTGPADLGLVTYGFDPGVVSGRE